MFTRAFRRYEGSPPALRFIFFVKPPIPPSSAVATELEKAQGRAGQLPINVSVPKMILLWFGIKNQSGMETEAHGILEPSDIRDKPSPKLRLGAQKRLVS